MDGHSLLRQAASAGGPSTTARGYRPTSELAKRQANVTTDVNFGVESHDAHRLCDGCAFKGDFGLFK